MLSDADGSGSGELLAKVAVALRQVRWLPLAPAVLLTTVLPLTIHALMLSVGVPYPAPVSATGSIAWTADFFTACGSLLLLQRVGPGLLGRPALLRAAVLIVLVAGLSGRVFRDPFMDVINTAAPVVSMSTAGYLIDNLIKILPLGLIILLCAALPAGVASTSRIGRLAATALGISLAVWLLVGFVLNPLLAPGLAWLDAREGGAIELPPYDARILIPAYATFLENGITTIILVALLWGRLSGGGVRRVAKATGIVFLLLGPVAEPMIVGMSSQDHWLAFLGPFQFSLETLALGALAGLSCLVCLRQAGGRAASDCVGATSPGR